MPRQHEKADTKTLNKYGDREGGTGGFYTGRFLLKDYSTDLALQSSNIVKLTLLVSKLMQQNQGYIVFLIILYSLLKPGTYITHNQLNHQQFDRRLGCVILVQVRVSSLSNSAPSGATKRFIQLVFHMCSNIPQDL